MRLLQGLKGPLYTQAVDSGLSLFSTVVCHLEGSGQWPQNAEAIRRVRAFQLRLAEAADSAAWAAMPPQPRTPTSSRLGGHWAGIQGEKGTGYSRVPHLHPSSSNRMGLCSGSVWPTSGAADPERDALEPRG